MKRFLICLLVTFIVTQLALCLIVIGAAFTIAFFEMGFDREFLIGFKQFTIDVFTRGLFSIGPILPYSALLVFLGLRTGWGRKPIRLSLLAIGLTAVFSLSSKLVMDKINDQFFGTGTSMILMGGAVLLACLTGAWALWRTVVWLDRRSPSPSETAVLRSSAATH